MGKWLFFYYYSFFFVFYLVFLVAKIEFFWFRFPGVSDLDEPGGPLHHSLYAQVQQDMYADMNRKYDGFRGCRNMFSLKRRGRPKKYMTTGNPIGRPRKFRPHIGDPIKFLQAASLSGLFKVNDENAQISGLSSFLNPNFRNTGKTTEIKPDSVEQQSTNNSTEISDPPIHDSNDTKACFACQFCGKSYKKKKHYNRHVNFECINTEPRFLCTMCSYKARRKEHLIRHLRSHIGDMMNASDYGLVSGFKEESSSEISIDSARHSLEEPADLTVPNTNLPMNNHNGQVYSAPFGFVTL